MYQAGKANRYRGLSGKVKKKKTKGRKKKSLGKLVSRDRPHEVPAYARTANVRRRGTQHPGQILKLEEQYRSIPSPTQQRSGPGYLDPRTVHTGARRERLHRVKQETTKTAIKKEVKQRAIISSSVLNVDRQNIQNSTGTRFNCVPRGA